MAVMNDVFSLRMHIPEPDQKNRQKEIETETEYLGKQMRELEGQAKRLYTLYAQVSDPMLINAVRDINKRREEIEQRLAVLQETTTSFGLEDSIFDTVESLKKTWDLMNINERRNVLNSIISSITIKEGEINIMYRIGGIS